MKTLRQDLTVKHKISQKLDLPVFEHTDFLQSRSLHLCLQTDVLQSDIAKYHLYLCGSCTQPWLAMPASSWHSKFPQLVNDIMRSDLHTGISQNKQKRHIFQRSLKWQHRSVANHMTNSNQALQQRAAEGSHPYHGPQMCLPLVSTSKPSKTHTPYFCFPCPQRTKSAHTDNDLVT
jgi:hypothetical protein